MTKIVCDFCGNNAEFQLRRIPVKDAGWMQAGQSAAQQGAPYEAEVCWGCICKLKQMNAPPPMPEK